jgi:hypothetical protein
MLGQLFLIALGKVLKGVLLIGNSHNPRKTEKVTQESSPAQLQLIINVQKPVLHLRMVAHVLHNIVNHRALGADSDFGPFFLGVFR